MPTGTIISKRDACKKGKDTRKHTEKNRLLYRETHREKERKNRERKEVKYLID